MFAGDGVAVGGPVPGGVAVDGSQLPPAVDAEPVAAAHGTEDRGVAVHATVGPHRIGYHLGIPRSTVGRVLARYRMPKLAHIDRSTGLPVRKSPPVRYELEVPGQLVHVDIKKLGRIPDGGGHRVLGRQTGKRNNDGHGRGGRGYAFLHHAIDDHSRLAYSEILSDERKETAAGFWERANAFYASVGVTVTAVMTDNGSCYRSREFAAALQNASIKHRRTRAYRPQTNGKVCEDLSWCCAGLSLTPAKV